MSALLFLLAVLPVVIICTHIYRKDKHKEPWILLIKLFILGTISCVVVLLFSEVMFSIFPFMRQDTSNMTFFQVMMYSFVGVALVEEFCKWIMTMLGAYKNKQFDEVYDGIIYSVYVSLGFAFVENILYIFSSNSVKLGITRAILAVPGHACDAIFMGYYLSLAKAYANKINKKGERKNLVLSIIVPTILHGFYDFCLFSGNLILLIFFAIFIICLWIFSIKKVKKLSMMSDRNIVSDNKNIKQQISIQQEPAQQIPMQQEYPVQPQTAQQIPIQQEYPVQPQPTNLIKFCSKCGAPLTSDVCQRCGTKS